MYYQASETKLICVVNHLVHQYFNMNSSSAHRNPNFPINICSSVKSYKHNKARIDKFLSDWILCFCDIARDDETNDPTGVEVLLLHMISHYPLTCRKYVKKSPTTSVLSPLQSAALICDANVSDNVAYKVINRHYRAATGRSLFSPQRTINQFSENKPPLKFSTYDWDKAGEGKKKEKVSISTMEIDTAIERKMDLYLKYTMDTNLHPLPTPPNPPFHLQPPLLGYNTESGPGVVALFGSDHGGSHSQNILQLNVESSGYRRKKRNQKSVR